MCELNRYIIYLYFMLYFVEQFRLMLSIFSFMGSSLVTIAAARNDGGFKGFAPRSFAIDSSQTEIKQYHISMHSRSVSPRIVLVRNFASLCLGVSFFFVCAAPVFAQLKWEKVEQTFAPGPLDKQVAAKYRFTNIGTAPVSINEVRAGKEVDVNVTPPNTSKPENAVLSIRTDYPPQNPETHYACAQVK